MMNNKIRATGIVIKDNAILLMFRRKNGDEYYTFPGGAVEKGESPEEAVVRELKEETSVSVSVGELLSSLGGNSSIEQRFYWCTYVSGEPALGESEERKKNSHENYYKPMWITLDALKSLLVHPETVKNEIMDRLISGNN